jgi:hypothetical protein
MATEKIHIYGNTWTDITAALGLVSGTKYTLQNRSGADLWVSESSSAPTDDQVSHIVRQTLFLYLDQDTLSFYAKSNGDSSMVVVTEAE